MNIAGKTILITGSTDGLGKLVAKHVAEQGANVLIHGRNEAKGEFVRNELLKVIPDAQLKYYNADFSSLQQVSKLAGKLASEPYHLDILINNVGIGSGKSGGNRRELSKEGIELRFAVNYVAHVLLTEKLLTLLKQGSVIINVASVGQAKIDFSNIMLEKGYEGFLAYRQSKTALIMYTFDLAERLKDKGITVNVLHPASLMNTNMVMKDWGYTLTTVEEGAEAVENLLSPESTGEYYDGKRRAKAISQVYDQKAREELRKVTWDLLKGFL